MTAIDYLPRRWDQSFRRMAVPGLKNLVLGATPDYEYLFSHFLGDALTADWTAAKTNGTAAAVTVAGSALTCTAGTTDNGYAGQGYGLHWSGDKGFYFATRVALDTLTTSKIEIGVTDATADAGAVNAKATPSATATDFCVLVRDTDDNTALDLISQRASGVAANAEGVFTVAAATAFTVEMVGEGDTVAVFVNGQNVGAGNIEGGSAITPWVFAQVRTGSASRILTAEWMIMVGPQS